MITKQHSGTLERGDYICRVVNVISMGKSENKKKKGVRCQTKKGKIKQNKIVQPESWSPYTPHTPCFLNYISFISGQKFCH